MQTDREEHHRGSIDKQSGSKRSNQSIITQGSNREARTDNQRRDSTISETRSPRERRTRKNRLKAGAAKEIISSDTLELIMTLIVMNACLAVIYLSKVVFMKLVYMLIANVVVGTTIYFRERRLSRQVTISHELESKLTKKDDLEQANSTQLTINPTGAGRSPDASPRKADTNNNSARPGKYIGNWAPIV